ncbi:MAG TPA: hypothetical protein VGZ93_10645 [Candidatus Methylacidiphilales bacterium]|jgi:hypothetical protein|nr:hypothetical protein [Candidatus Methylacidiphilales bacterium]
MSEGEAQEDFAKRREFLAAQIARQRGELAEAYRNLERPLHYAEYGLRGFGFLRKNPWIFVAAPAAVKVAATFFGVAKKKLAGAGAEERRGVGGRARKGIGKHLATWGGHGWRLYKLYRRARSYFP